MSKQDQSNPSPKEQQTEEDKYKKDKKEYETRNELLVMGFVRICVNNELGNYEEKKSVYNDIGGFVYKYYKELFYIYDAKLQQFHDETQDIVKAEDDPKTQEEIDELNELNDIGSESW